MKTLKENEIVKFVFPDETLVYTVKKNHLKHCNKGNNDFIFKKLKLKDQELNTIVDTAYGYTNENGLWPSSNHYDYEALTRLVEYLQAEIQKKFYTEGVKDLVVGKWYSYYDKDTSNEILGTLRVMSSHNGEGVWNGEYDIGWEVKIPECIAKRPASSAEILKALLVNVDNNYKDSTALCLHDCHTYDSDKANIFDYDIYQDCLRYDKGRGCIYENGKWATPIPKSVEQTNDVSTVVTEKLSTEKMLTKWLEELDYSMCGQSNPTGIWGSIVKQDKHSEIVSQKIISLYIEKKEVIQVKPQLINLIKVKQINIK